MKNLLKSVLLTLALTITTSINAQSTEKFIRIIGNYIMDGYWWTLRYRTYEPSQSNSAEALYIQVKQKGQYNYENGSYFENFLGY